MRKFVRRDEGAAAVELSIVLPILMVFLAFVAPIIKFGYEYMVIQRAAAHGVRYASRTDPNARYAEDGVTLTRRPSSGEVRQFVSDSSDGTIDPAAVEVNPSPMFAVPGELVTVTIAHEMDYGPLADIANAVKGAFFGGGAFLPSSTTVTVSARGREE